MYKSFKKRYAFALIFLILIISINRYFYTVNDTEYFREYSSDGQYSVYIKAYKHDLMIDIVKFPFQKSGDRSGRIYLYDEVEKRVLTTASVAMIGDLDIEWTEDHVYTKGGELSKSLPRKIIQ